MEDLNALKKQISELVLSVQTLEQRVVDLENGSFGTGVYLDGCNESDAEFIRPNQDKKEGK